MAETIRLDSNAESVIRYFGALPRVTQQEIVAGIKRGLIVMVSKVLQGTALKWRRGAAGLAGRLTSFAKLGGPMGIDAAIGFRKTRGFPYELAQEFGAKARAGGAMSIPLSQQARAASERGQGPREFGVPLRLMKNLLVEDKNKSVIVHYVLVKSIPPRLNFMKTVRANVGLIERGIMNGLRAGEAKARAAT